MPALWITKEGEKIEISKMASSHLLATIHYIERNRFTNAIEVATRGNVDLNDPILDYYMRWHPQYAELVAEAQRRGLINRNGTTDIPRKRLK